MAGKRMNGEGSVYWDDTAKRYVAALTYRGPDGTRKRRRRFRKTEREAEKELTLLISERNVGTILEVSNPILRQYLIGWLRDSVSVSVDPKTLEGYEVACRVHIIPKLGNIRLRDLRSRQIQTLYADKRKEGLSVRTRRNIHATLKRALRQAVAWGELASSPVEMLDSPKAPSEEEEDEEKIQALTDEEARQLFVVARETGSRFRNLYVVAVRTGLRQGELLGLKWKDLNLTVEPAVLVLRRSLAPNTEGGGYRYTPTKRKRQRRKLALHWEGADALRDQVGLQIEEKGAARGRWRENALVFPSTIGTPMSARNLYRRDFKPLIEQAELPDISFHDLRHTFASIMLYEWGTSPRLVQEMLGHSSIKVTMDTYSHLLPNAQGDEIQRLARLYKKGVAQ